MRACPALSAPRAIVLWLIFLFGAIVHGCANALSYACFTGNCQVIDLLIAHGRELERTSPGAYRKVRLVQWWTGVN